MSMINNKIKAWEKEAGKVCHDFDLFCDYLLERKAKLSKTTGYISKMDCFELNGLLSVKETFDKPARFQKNYPVINFFYYVAVRYRILEPDLKGCCMRPGYNYAYYRDAAVLEKFLLMAMTLLFDQHFFEVDNRLDITLIYLMYWAEKNRPRTNKVYILPENITRGIYPRSRSSLMTYMDEMGVLRLLMQDSQGAAGKDDSWQIEIGPLFELVCDLHRTVHEEFDNEKEELPIFCFGTFWETHISGGEASGLKKIFEEQHVDYGNQVIDLEIQVRYAAAIRVVRMNLSDSLYKLHRMIQKVFEFDNDHLFAFYLGTGILKSTFTIPEAFTMGDEYSVHDTTLGDLQVRRGDKFSYLFDFGDQWWFDIKVVEVTEGSIPHPELIKAIHKAPPQYPMYDDDTEEWPVRADEQLQVKDVLDTIPDDCIEDEYAVLMGQNKTHDGVSCDEMRRDIERMVMEEPKRLLLFITPDMRKMLAGLLKDRWVESSECCILDRLYSLGFCMTPGEGEDEVLIPGRIKEVYGALVKKAVKADMVAENAERILAHCGVIEMDRLYTALGKGKGPMPYEELQFMIYSRLHYFGRYECSNQKGKEIISCYDAAVTEKILKEREAPGNRTCTYPDFEHMSQEDLETMPAALDEWKSYVRFNLNINGRTSESLSEQVPQMAASGVIPKDKIIEWYRDTVRKAGSRATKKGERLIGNLCETMPLATRKGNQKTNQMPENER